LKKGLSIWSEILELPDIDPKIVEQILFKIQVELPKIDKKVTLQDVGFGISQILPVYVESLRMKKGHTLILEQPEIHLHPSMQSKLADFLLSMVVSGKNFIIETHSEYILNRLSLRIAQDQTDKLKDLISIVFIEPPRDDENLGFLGAKINDLELNRYGEIINWPVGFFDQHDYDKMLKAAIEKRKNDTFEGKK
jgi:predicted ATPase